MAAIGFASNGPACIKLPPKRGGAFAGKGVRLSPFDPGTLRSFGAIGSPEAIHVAWSRKGRCSLTFVCQIFVHAAALSVLTLVLQPVSSQVAQIAQQAHDHLWRITAFHDSMVVSTVVVPASLQTVALRLFQLAPGVVQQHPHVARRVGLQCAAPKRTSVQHGHPRDAMGSPLQQLLQSCATSGRNPRVR